MDLEIFPGDIDCTHRIGVLNKGKNRPKIVCKIYGQEASIYQQKETKRKAHVNYQKFN